MDASQIARSDYYSENTKGILQTLDDNIDNAIQIFIFDVYDRLIVDYRAVIINLAIISILFYSFQLYKGRVGATLEELGERVVIIMIVFGLLLNMGTFIEFVHHVFMGWPEEFIQSVVRSMNSVVVHPTNGDAIKGTLDVYLDQAWKLGIETAKLGSITDPMPWIMSVAIFIIGTLLVVIPFGLAAVANVTTAVLLALTPLFLVFLFFKKTTGFFESWVRSIMTMVFLKILAYTVMVLSLFILKAPMENMIDNAILRGAVIFSVFVPYLVSAFVMFMFYRNISGLAAGLGSGFTVQASRISERGMGAASSYIKSKMN